MAFLYNVIAGKHEGTQVIESSCLGIFLTQKEAIAAAKEVPNINSEFTFAEVYSSNQNRLCFALHKIVHKWANVTSRIKA